MVRITEIYDKIVLNDSLKQKKFKSMYECILYCKKKKYDKLHVICYPRINKIYENFMNLTIYSFSEDLCCPKCNIKHIEYNNGKPEYYNVGSIEILGRYDGVLYFECMNCGTQWNRFTYIEEK